MSECDYCHGDGVRNIHDEHGNYEGTIQCGKCNGSGKS